MADALGIENVWLGRYQRADGSVLQGPSLRELVAARDAAVAERTTRQIAASVAAAQAIQAPFDREIIGGKEAPGHQRIQKAIDSLVQQSKDLVDAAAAIVAVVRAGGLIGRPSRSIARICTRRASAG